MFFVCLHSGSTSCFYISDRCKYDKSEVSTRTTSENFCQSFAYSLSNVVLAELANLLDQGSEYKKTYVFDSVLNYCLKTVGYSTSVTVYDPCSGHIATHVDPLQATLKEIVYCDSQGHIRIN